MSLPILIWAIGMALTLGGELWALRRSEGETITSQFKRHWWSRGIMLALNLWALWHFFTDAGGWFDLFVVAVGFCLGAFADRMKLRPSREES